MIFQHEVKTVIEADQQTSQSFVQGADTMLADIVASTKTITDTLIDKIEVSTV